MYFSASPVIACAVIAMIGIWPPDCGSESRIFCVASTPPITGIWISIKTQVKGIWLQQLERFPAIGSKRDLVAHLFEQAQRQLLVHAVVFHKQQPQAADFFHLSGGDRSLCGRSGKL